MSMRELVVFVVGGRRCALDLAVVERVEPMVAVTALPGAPPAVLGAIDVHGSIVAMLDLRSRLDLPAAEPDPDACVLLARTRPRIVALPVDEVLGVQAVEATAVTSTEALGVAPGHAAGVASLPDGLLLIHDLEAFLSLDEERLLAPALADAAR